MKFSSKISESLTLKFAQAAQQRRENGERIISLGLGEPDFDTPKEIIDATINVLKKGTSKYGAALGTQKLREIIADKLFKDNGIKTEINNILIAPGAKNALQIVLMALLEPGDEVILLMPAYVSYVPQILISEPDTKINYVNIDKETHKLDIQDIKNLITDKTKAIIINTPNNPSGVVLSEEELKELYMIASKSNSYIISDEVYEKMIFNSKKHFSIGSLEDKPSKVITVNGFSKSHAMTGWRIGYSCFPDELRNKIIKIQQHINTNTCTFIQDALSEVLPINEEYIYNYCRLLENRCDLYNSFLEGTPLLKGVIPNGSFFAFLDISETGLDSNTFASKLIDQTGVALTPGLAFGKDWDDHVRISLAVKDDILKEAFSLIKEFVEKL